MRVIYTILIVSLLTIACNNTTQEQQDNTTPTSTAAPTQPKKDVIVPETKEEAIVALKEGKNVTVRDNVKQSILGGTWKVASWGSEELRNSMDNAYTDYAKQEAAKTYTFEEHRNLTVKQGDEVIDQGNWSMGGKGQDIKISLREKKFIATMAFNSPEELSLTWQEEGANITMVLQKN